MYLIMEVNKFIHSFHSEEIPLTLMGVLAPGSAHARPSAQPPIDMSGNFPAHVPTEPIRVEQVNRSLSVIGQRGS